MEANTNKTSTSATNNNKLILIALSVIVVASVVAAIVFYNKYNSIKQNPQAITSAQTSTLVKEVGKLITLPSNETPTVATVQDKTKLASQPFFAGAQNGDKLLIYTNNRKAIIYRPSTNKIINVGPIAIDTGSTTSGTSSNP